MTRNFLKHYRKGTADEHAMSAVRGYFKAMRENGLSVTGKVVLDIGAHIGAFSRMAIDAGAKRVVSYEPHRQNFLLLKKNCSDAELHEAALVSDDRSTTDLTIGRQHNEKVGTERFSTSRSLKNNNVLVSKVRCESFARALKKVQVIKLDAEGAEHDLLNGVDMPASVEFLVGEFDCFGSFRLPDGTMTRDGRSNNYRSVWNLIKRMKDQGFAYRGPRNMRLPRHVMLIQVLFVRD